MELLRNLGQFCNPSSSITASGKPLSTMRALRKDKEYIIKASRIAKITAHWNLQDYNAYRFKECDQENPHTPAHWYYNAYLQSLNLPSCWSTFWIWDSDMKDNIILPYSPLSHQIPIPSELQAIFQFSKSQLTSSEDVTESQKKKILSIPFFPNRPNSGKGMSLQSTKTNQWKRFSLHALQPLHLQFLESTKKVTLFQANQRSKLTMYKKNDL